MTLCVTVPDQWEETYLDELQVEPKDADFGGKFQYRKFANRKMEKRSDLKHQWSLLSSCYSEKQLFCDAS